MVQKEANPNYGGVHCTTRCFRHKCYRLRCRDGGAACKGHIFGKAYSEGLVRGISQLYCLGRIYSPIFPKGPSFAVVRTMAIRNATAKLVPYFGSRTFVHADSVCIRGCLGGISPPAFSRGICPPVCQDRSAEKCLSPRLASRLHRWPTNGTHNRILNTTSNQ